MDKVVSHWSANAVVLLACAVVVAAHLLGMRAIAADARSGGRPVKAGAVREAVIFYLGVLVVVLAFASPVGYWAQRHLWVRALQDLLLVEVAPSLMVLGGPWSALARGLRLRRGRTQDAAAAVAAGPASQAGPARAEAKAQAARSAWPGSHRQTWMTRSLAAAVGMNVAWWVLHLPAIYDAALTSPWAYAAEAVTLLGVGLVFWLHLIGSGDRTPPFPPVRRVILVAGTVVSGTVLAMVLAFGRGLLYASYSGLDGGVRSAVSDQQVAGAIFWVLPLPPLVIAAVALLARWLKNEESEALAAGLDRLLDPPTSAWPSRPGLR